MTGVGPRTTEYLRRLGYSDRKIATFTGDTRLFHDLGLFEDSAEEDFLVLQLEYEVDFSGFVLAKYFPPEVQWSFDHFVLTFFWRTRWADKAKAKYPPITFDMIEQTITNRKWLFG